MGAPIIGRIFASEIWGAYFQKGLSVFFFRVGGGGRGLIIGILRHNKGVRHTVLFGCSL